MSDSFAEFANAAAPVVRVCDDFIERHRLQGQVRIDHVCYKCAGHSHYEELRAMLERSPATAFVYQVQLSGRRVAYIGLKEGFPSAQQPIRFLELSDRKPHTEEASGFHHAEIYPVEMDLPRLLQTLATGGEHLQRQDRPHHATDDLVLPDGFILRFTARPLIEKIVQEQLALPR